MAEYCPSCGTERTEQNDECGYCGAYVTRWETLPILTAYSGDQKEEEPESGTNEFLEMLFQEKNLPTLMRLAALLVIFLMLSLGMLLEKL